MLKKLIVKVQAHYRTLRDKHKANLEEKREEYALPLPASSKPEAANEANSAQETLNTIH